MALETFTIDDKIYLSWSKSLLQSTSLFYRCCLEPAAARFTRAQSYYSNAAPVSGLYAVVRGRRQPARGKQKHRRTNETDINDS